MVLYVVSAIIIVLIIINYFLGYKLYKEPSNTAYFSNVNHYNVIHQRDIMPSPKYIFCISASLRDISRNIYITWKNY